MQLGKEGLSYLLLIKGFIVNPDMNIQWNLLITATQGTGQNGCYIQVIAIDR